MTTLDSPLLESEIREILELLQKQRKTLATAESCTAGRVALAFGEISGASSVFKGGVVAYQNSAKTAILGVDSHLIAAHSPYSFEVVGAMLEGALAAFDADFAIATSGVAGPGGGSAQNPVGVVFVGVKMRGFAARIKRFCFEVLGEKTAEDSRRDLSQDLGVDSGRDSGRDSGLFAHNKRRIHIQENATKAAINLALFYLKSLPKSPK